MSKEIVKHNWLSLSNLVIWVTFLAIFAMAAQPSLDSDTWWHLRTGQWILENRAIPAVDPFSYTRAGEAWPHPGWLIQIPMIWIYQALGPGGLNLWVALMVTAAFMLVWRTLSGGVFLRAFVLVIAAATSGVYWAARPYLVTFLMSAAFLAILESIRKDTTPSDEPEGTLLAQKPPPSSLKRLLRLPVLMVIWVNSHGGFATGFLIWGTYLAGELARAAQRLVNREPLISEDRYRLAWWSGSGVLMVLAVCLNPDGPVMLLYAFKTVSIDALQDFILEWQSPDFHLAQAQPALWLLLMLIAALGVSRQRIRLTDFLLAAGFTYLALLAWRNLALFALALPMVITRHAADPLAEFGGRVGFHGASADRPVGLQALLNTMLLAALALAAIARAAVAFPLESNREAWRQTLPVDAVSYLEVNPQPGRLFNSYNWGAYLIWELPEQPVFIDGRTDLYNDDVIGQWLKVVRGDTGWQETLDHWGVHLLLIEPSLPLNPLLPDNGWIEIYRDEVAVIYRR